jgi:hypothetical protein
VLILKENKGKFAQECYCLRFFDLQRAILAGSGNSIPLL